MADVGLRIVERLHQGRSCSIARALRRDGSPVIVKQRSRRLSSADEIARLEQEYELLRTLEVTGVAKALEYLQLDGGPAIVFEDLGGVSLRRLRESGVRRWHDWLATAVNGEIVHRDERAGFELKESDRVEILSPMQGG